MGMSSALCVLQQKIGEYLGKEHLTAIKFAAIHNWAIDRLDVVPSKFCMKKNVPSTSPHI
jgi:hypothetical protein